MMRSLRIAVIAGCLALAPLAAQAAVPDAWITTKAKLAVLSTVGTAGTSIHVDTVDGLVTLHGAVASAEEKAKAEEAARKIDGVKKVRNLLQVVSAKEEKAVAASDSEIERQVRNALQRDQILKNESGIKVQSVNKGTVLLAGKASSLSTHLRAIEAARAVPGVRTVASEIESPDSKMVRETELLYSNPGQAAKNEERNFNDTLKDTAKGAKDATVGAARSAKDATVAAAGSAKDAAKDMYITSATKARLIADRKTPGMDINVDTTNGVVTLFGAVPDETAKAKAEEEARKVAGVTKVVNELEVVPAGKAKGVSSRDGDVQKSIEKSVANRKDLSDASISVEVHNGVARLTGTAPSKTVAKQAESIAKQTSGVRSVRNEIKVESN